MMQLSRSRPLVRWAYFPDNPPYQTTLCALFWRVVVVTPVRIIVPTAVLLALVGFLAAVVFKLGTGLGWWALGRFLITVVGIGLTTYWVGSRTKARAERRRLEAQERQQRGLPPPEPSALSLAWQAVKAAKRRVCPLIELSDVAQGR